MWMNSFQVHARLKKHIIEQQLPNKTGCCRYEALQMNEESSTNYMLAPETNGKPLKVLESVWRPETNDFTFDLKALVRFLTERKGTKGSVLHSSTRTYDFTISIMCISRNGSGRGGSPGMKNCHQIWPENGNSGVQNSLIHTSAHQTKVVPNQHAAK